MRVRLHGTRQQVAVATRRLVEVVAVVSISGPYPDRGASVLVRVYLQVHLNPAGSGTPAAPGRSARRPSRPLP